MKKDFHIEWRLPDGHILNTPGYRRLNLLAHADYFDIDLPQKCGGQAECGTCRIRIIEGETSDILFEERELRNHPRGKFLTSDRLACRARPRSDLIVEVLAVMPIDLRDDE